MVSFCGGYWIFFRRHPFPRKLYENKQGLETSLATIARHGGPVSQWPLLYQVLQHCELYILRANNLTGGKDIQTTYQ